MERLKEKLGIEEEHILEARGIAEGIYKKPPHIQVEMIAEIKKSVKKRLQATSDQLNTV